MASPVWISCGLLPSTPRIRALIRGPSSRVSTGPEYGKTYSGIHHIGFEVESLEEIAKKLQEASSSPREDINQALGVGMPGARHANVEVKYGGPDGVIIDISETGWVGTRGLD